MKVLSLDISTRTGWSLTVRTDENKDKDPTIIEYGNVMAEQKVSDWGKYPFNYINLAEQMAKTTQDLIQRLAPDVIVIEETNKGKQRYSQKMLEFLHCALLQRLKGTAWEGRVFYINTSDWRKALDIYMSKEDKKNNAKVNKAKRQGKSKKELGLKGKITRKHIAIRVVAERFNLVFKQKENDIAEAICLGVSYHLGAPICDGKK